MSATEKSSSQDRWRDGDIKEVIKLVKAYTVNGKFDGTVRDNEIYKQISAELATKSIYKTVLQIRNKIKALKRQYRLIKDKMNDSGGNLAHSFRYFEALDCFLGLPSIRNVSPDFIVSQDPGTSNQNCFTPESDNEFPFDRPRILSKRIKAVGQENWKPTSNSSSAQFNETDYQVRPGAAAKRFRSNAVPSVLSKANLAKRSLLLPNQHLPEAITLQSEIPQNEQEKKILDSVSEDQIRVVQESLIDFADNSDDAQLVADLPSNSWEAVVNPVQNLSSSQDFNISIKKEIIETEIPETVEISSKTEEDCPKLVENTMEDEFSHFAKNVACQLRQLPLKSALLTQTKILDILAKERIAVAEGKYTTSTVLPVIAQYSKSTAQQNRKNSSSCTDNCNDEAAEGLSNEMFPEDRGLSN